MIAKASCRIKSALSLAQTAAIESRWMKRRLFGMTSLISLLLCVAALVLWVRSYWYYDVLVVPLPHPWSHVSINGIRGRAEFWVHRSWLEPVHAVVGTVRLQKVEFIWPPSRTADMMPHPPSFEFRYIDASHSGMDIRFYVIALPHWFLAALLAMAPALFLWRRLRASHRLHRNLCRNCGYDLRASPGRCPECGASSQQAAAVHGADSSHAGQS